MTTATYCSAVDEFLEHLGEEHFPEASDRELLVHAERILAYVRLVVEIAEDLGEAELTELINELQ